jgi:hypothetical protein
LLSQKGYGIDGSLIWCFDWHFELIEHFPPGRACPSRHGFTFQSLRLSLDVVEHDALPAILPLDATRFEFLMEPPRILAMPVYCPTFKLASETSLVV